MASNSNMSASTNLPAGYNPPSVFTQTTISYAQPIVSGADKTVALIGVSDETRSAVGREIIRGSSATLDNPIFGEDVSNAADGRNTVFTVDYQIVTGSGQGIISTDPASLTVYVNGEIVNVLAVNGNLRQFTLQTAPFDGDVVTVDYFFKKKDTFVLAEDHTTDVPIAAKLHTKINANATLYLALATPGPAGNFVKENLTGPCLQFISSPAGSSDYEAIQGNGTDFLIVDIALPPTSGVGTPESPSTNLRTSSQLVALINTYGFTLSGGMIQASYTGTDSAAVLATMNTVSNSSSPLISGALPVLTINSVTHSVHGFWGGIGQNTSTTFQVDHFPIVDGSNGGITTTNVSYISVFVNSAKATVTSLDGLHGTFTLAEAVPEGATLTVTYHYNRYQNTADILPNQDVLSVQQCGYSGRGIDFIPGADFALANNAITWGNAATVQPLFTTYDATPFGPQASVMVYDNQVFLRPTSRGACDGHNIIFTLPSIPTDGSGTTGTATDDPTLIKVYVGANPHSAYLNGPVEVVRVTGAASQIMLQTAPAVNSKVYVSYTESLIADDTITLTCAVSGPVSVGTYSASSTNGAVPQYTVTTPTDSLLTHRSGWATNKIIFPHHESDLMGIPGSSPAETITLTFVDNFHFKVTSSRTTSNVNQDGFGITGGATTPSTSSTYTATAGTALGTQDANSIDLFSNSVLDGDGNAVILNGDPLYFDTTWAAVGADGYLNQTFVDANTGVRFTILDPLAANANPIFGATGVTQTYSFQAGDQIQLVCSLSSTFATSESYMHFVPGVRVIVRNALTVVVGDTAKISTYSKSGDQPNVGDVYYVSYTYAKPASAYDLQVYYNTQEQQVYNDYGYPSATNTLALAAWVAFRNNAKVVGLLQVKKDNGLNTASDSKYAAALTQLQTLYPGMTRKPQIIVPLTTSQYFLPFLKKHVETQSSVKMMGECVGFFGFANNTNPSTAITACQTMASNRMVGVYPDGGVITITDTYGNSRDVVVDGSMVAVALAALYGNPEWDTATPRTRKQIMGFKSLYRRLDANTQNSVAQAGCTLIEQMGATFRVRHAVTTDTSNVLTIQPSVTFLADETQADIRDILDPFIGKKFLDSVITDMKSHLVAYFKSKISAEKIQTYGSINVSRDPNDSRVAQVSASYVPVGELTYIFVNLFISSTAE